ncbi:MAG: bifunctional UDP-3-O-[3-hydroxymyristoyl] N-acetylglucosamine deacetylase/3-hydroxyacyl-ACP dehydratase [Bacteroidota bacterium]|nr:bifunctional UDP-3-O-[3-hydroxymyristoyl] N-acetylglucosamine deacetylase/3-hydroxyacyl-ACP dehydratase [Bacteroidota bacterium]
MIDSLIQHTLNSEIEFSGVGLHTGCKCTMKVFPAEDNHGYKFQRRDLDGEPIIDATTNNVSSTLRSTSLSKDGVEVHTTEHILAALYAMGIDNALISLDAPEIPIMDGSALEFITEIKRVGSKELTARRKVYKFRKNISFVDKEKEIEMIIVPNKKNEFKVTVMVDYKSPVLGTQHASIDGLENFEKELASCRTFVFMKEVAHLAEKGLIKGGEVDNAVVLADRPYSIEELAEIGKNIGRGNINILPNKTGVVSTSELRFNNEPARHKLLDILGDIALTGRYLIGHILAARPGHYSNVEFAKLMSDTIKKTEDLPDLRTDREPILDINAISNILPHRYPFLLVDSILDMNENSITGIKNVTMNEPYFQGHFPANPVMPGVLQVEAMAQVGGVFALSTVDDPEYWSTYFMKIDDVRFKQKVLPGDTIVFHLELASPIRRGLVHMNGKGYVRGKLVSQAVLLAQIVKDRAPE